MTHRTAAMCFCAVLLGGCSSVNVVKNPSPGDNGIRYYRPKPYLMVSPADATGRMVKLEVLYLPDYCEEYSIHPRGKKPPAVQLKDGWNLVGVGGGAAPAEKAEGAPPAPPTDPLKLPEAVLVAGNVPIGLYESVFDTAGPVKYLKGWRYVGFSPLGGGGLPNGTDAAATASAMQGCPACTSPNSVLQGPLYGIVFFNGAMTFRQVDEIANNMTCPSYIKPPVGPVNDGNIIITPINPAPAGSGIQAVPAAPAVPVAPTVPAAPTVPVAPAPATPRTSTFRTPKPSSYQMDAGVRQTSSTTKRLAAKVVTTTSTSTSAPKVTDPKTLAALEAEVFRSLSYSPPAGKQGSSPSKSSDSAGTVSATTGVSVPSAGSAALVPDLSPATPIR